MSRIEEIVEREVANARPRFRFVHAHNTPSDIARDIAVAVAKAVVEECLQDALAEARDCGCSERIENRINKWAAPVAAKEKP